MKFMNHSSGHRRTEFLAGRFAGKEAFAKAKGTGIGAECNFTDIEILPDSNGKPDLISKGVLFLGLFLLHIQKDRCCTSNPSRINVQSIPHKMIVPD